MKTITVTAAQGEETSPQPYTSEQLVTDLSAGGSLRGKGTLEGRSGGMYDMDFPRVGDNTTVTFDVTAKRRSGTTATQASFLVTVPGMHPEFSGATGMTFQGSAALHPMFVAKTRTGGEVILERVEGRVTNSLGDAGGARASVHVKVEKGRPTLMRITIDNTSAGYRYLDTGDQALSWYQLNDTLDTLLSGSVKLG